MPCMHSSVQFPYCVLGLHNTWGSISASEFPFDNLTEVSYLCTGSIISIQVQITSLYPFKPTSQENINPAVPARFFARCLFCEIGSSSADFLDLEQCRKVTQRSPDGRRQETVRPPADSLCKWQIFGLCPADVQETIARGPGCDRRGSCRSPPDDNESCGHRLFTFWWPCSHSQELYWCTLGSNMKLIFNFFFRDLGKIAKASLFSVQQQNIITIFVTHCSCKYIIAST